MKSFLLPFKQMLFSPVLPILNTYKLLNFSSPIAALIQFSLLLRAYSAQLFLSSLPQSAMLTRPLLPSLLGRYNCSTFYIGCSPLYMVTIFLIFQFISFTSSFVHSIMPAPYQTVDTTHMFITWNTCFAFNFDFNVVLSPLKYSFLMFSFILSWHKSPFSKIPRYLYPPSPIWPIYSLFSNITFDFFFHLHSQNTTVIYTKFHTYVLCHNLDCSYKAINLILVAPIELQVVYKE